MKDVRLVDLDDGTIGVFTRPRRTIAGHGKIGFARINSLDELTPENIINAKILKNQFIPEEWGGVNQATLLENGKIGVLGHTASHDDRGDKHYYAVSFVLDPKTFECTKMKIIATRTEFPEGEMKVHYPEKPNELADVIFPGGLIRNNDKTATIYCGLSDCEGGKLTIEDPFIEKE